MSSQPDHDTLYARVRQIRREVYGEQGIPLLAEALGIPLRTWENFEAGVAIPGPLLLEFLVVTNVNALWLLRGEGEPYLGRSSEQKSAN